MPLGVLPVSMATSRVSCSISSGTCGVMKELPFGQV
jgi:hypothetical protein